MLMARLFTFLTMFCCLANARQNNSVWVYVVRKGVRFDDVGQLSNGDMLAAGRKPQICSY